MLRILSKFCICMMRTTGTDGKNEQKQCPTGELLCEYEETDDLGGKIESFCIDKGMDIDGEFCPGSCLPKCSGLESIVFGGYDNKGCELPSTCA